MIEENLRTAKKKSVAPIRYVVKHELDGSPHYGASQIKYDRLHLETQHGSKTAGRNPQTCGCPYLVAGVARHRSVEAKTGFHAIKAGAARDDGCRSAA